MASNIFDNYEAFYNMLISTTIMSNSQTSLYEQDASSIIQFIGKSYKLSDETILECKSIIIDKLSALSLTTDQQAVYSSRQYGIQYSNNDILFDVKGDVLAKLQSMGNSLAKDISPSWFDYSHYKTYQPNIRFYKIKVVSGFGNLIATRQIGILLALGIGCEKDYTESIKRLSQCVFWGDIVSMHILAYVYELSGNSEKSKLFYDLAELSEKYLLSGYTIIPDDVKAKYSELVRTYFVYISSIKQDIVYAYGLSNIDFSFIEAITSNSLDYFQRMNYINNYEKREWKNITNSSEKPSRKLGFN